MLILLILTALSKADLSAALRKKYVRGFAAGTALWLMYMATLAGAGVFKNLEPPPRIVLFLIFPAFVFIAYFFWSKKFEALLRGIPPAWPVYLQSFRIAVELLILGVFLKGLATFEPTLEGYNFDILAGISAPIIAWLGFQRRVLPAWVLKYWNYAGLLLLVNVVGIFMTLMLKPTLWGYASTPIQPEFGTMPYLLIPAIFMPLAVFLHFFTGAVAAKFVVF
ncbi:MAG: hypothetical protein IPK76_03610 [Lewinellaceae bacterium]|nr:hypothetical protein [Lewinellaceae bacterium]